METSDMQYDVIVVGSGASGLTAAIRAAKAGLSVLVLAKAAHFGGTTAVSGGGIWIPGSPQAVAAGVEDGPAIARQSGPHLHGASADGAVMSAYLHNGLDMVD